MKRSILLLVAIIAATTMSMAQHKLTIDLWPDGAPNDNGNPEDTARVYVFLPRHAVGRSIVICPGGGYGGVAMKHEGFDWVPYFNNMGITVAVLKYRMPRGVKEVPATDAEQAIRLMRKNAKRWHLNPDEVGIMGFSAGGHLASTVATHAKDEAKPNFQILFYPVITMDMAYTHEWTHHNLIGKKPSAEVEAFYSNEKQVTKDTPRAFLFLADDDDVVKPSNGVNYYSALYENKVPAALYVYPSGGHGFGMNSNYIYHLEMLNALTSWLKSF